ncbi:MAG TPA: glycosyltransferase family 2 protein [Spirochaetota bacterium]|nr:glycosyltransferase family 2 protein [Spirochaetota bacterium]
MFISDSKKIYIFLPVHNRINETKNFIDCLKSQTYQNYHLLLIDDGSTDGTSEMVKKCVNNDKLTILRGKGNWWWGGALHQGYKWLKKNKINGDDIILIMNDDTIFENDFLESGVNLINKNPNSLILAYTYSFQTKVLLEKGVHVEWNDQIFSKANSIEEINCLQTMGLIFFIKDFYKIGGFHPILIPHYVSDYEFTIRANQKGYKLLTDESFKLYINEKTTNNDQKDKRPDNLFQFIKKTYSKRSPVNLISWVWFTILRTPLRWKINNLTKNFKITVKDLLFYIRQDIKKIFLKK